MALPLITDRLFLRAVEASDAAELARMWSDPELTRYLGGVRDYQEVYASVLAEAEEVAGGRVVSRGALLERATLRVIGDAGLIDKVVEGRAETEIFSLLDRSVWGRGYAAEIALALREYAFSSLGVGRVIALIDPDNVASIALATRIGLAFEREVVRPGDRRLRLYASAG